MNEFPYSIHELTNDGVLLRPKYLVGPSLYCKLYFEMHFTMTFDKISMSVGLQIIYNYDMHMLL